VTTSDVSDGAAPPPEDLPDSGRTVRVEEPQREQRSRTIISWTITIALALGLTFVVKTWFYQPFSIPSASMVPTLQVGDRVIVSKLNKDPGRGDIIVFDRPANDPAGPGEPDVLIKRVIGLPGETVSARDGKVYVDDKPLREAYLPAGVETEISSPIDVPPGDVLVMGDNRSVSQDGRYFGPISKDLIVGRAVLRIWPLSRFGSL
jgi:signal peptidase I